MQAKHFTSFKVLTFGSSHFKLCYDDITR